MGELPAPAWADPLKGLTEKVAKALTLEHRKRFADLAEKNGIQPVVAWKLLEKQCSRMKPKQRQLLRDVLSGWHDWCPEELSAISAQGGNPIEEAFESWEKAFI